MASGQKEWAGSAPLKALRGQAGNGLVEALLDKPAEALERGWCQRLGGEPVDGLASVCSGWRRLRLWLRYFARIEFLLPFRGFIGLVQSGVKPDESLKGFGQTL